jgi:hypothetical protein
MKSPIANGSTKPAPSGPSASKAHGDGAGPESQNGPLGTATIPPSRKDTAVLANHTGAEPLPVKNDHPNQ